MLTKAAHQHLKYIILHLIIIGLNHRSVSSLPETSITDSENKRDLEGVRNKNASVPLFNNTPSSLPTILFKKQNKVKNSDDVTLPIRIDPQECYETKFMYPFHPTHKFPDQEKLNEMAANPHCNWAFIGSEVCVPSLSCPVFKLPPNCDDNYMLVVDGHKGKQKFCGNLGPQDVIAADSLRDLYILVNGTQGQNNLSLQCEIKCTQRGVGNPLNRTFKAKIEPKCRCGERPTTNRIVNGYAGKKSEFPWLVAMVEAGTRQPFCGASIINDRFIVTAAHCFKGKYMDYRRVHLILEAEVLDTMPNGGVLTEKPEPIVYSPEQLDQADKGNGSVRVHIDEVILHPLYVSETNDFDVALIRTVERMNITWKGQTPVCLPKLGSYRKTYASVSAIVAGWGLNGTESTGTSSQLQKLNVTVFPQKACKGFYYHRINKRMMCAGYKDGGRDSCMGDSGGPLVYESEPKVWTQIGTVSWGEGCALANNPGVYYRTTETGQWLNYVSNSMDAIWCERPRSDGTTL